MAIVISNNNRIFELWIFDNKMAKFTELSPKEGKNPLTDAAGLPYTEDWLIDYAKPKCFLRKGTTT
nr:hypothetical protein [uncultured Dysosmobacter sp.]